MSVFEYAGGRIIMAVAGGGLGQVRIITTPGAHLVIYPLGSMIEHEHRTPPSIGRIA
ncbi:hypothetical protein ACSDR0_31170 [Streptosporangium sp. G11]|uniref:hypothetical protein n=1 Tax=Streptosporangium sp. G11 TaxID=3436926 RepID=UPI003EBBAAD8